MKLKEIFIAIIMFTVGWSLTGQELTDFPEVGEKARKGAFPLAASEAEFVSHT